MEPRDKPPCEQLGLGMLTRVNTQESYAMRCRKRLCKWCGRGYQEKLGIKMEMAWRHELEDQQPWLMTATFRAPRKNEVTGKPFPMEVQHWFTIERWHWDWPQWLKYLRDLESVFWKAVTRKFGRVEYSKHYELTKQGWPHIHWVLIPMTTVTRRIFANFCKRLWARLTGEEGVRARIKRGITVTEKGRHQGEQIDIYTDSIAYCIKYVNKNSAFNYNQWGRKMEWPKGHRCYSQSTGFPKIIVKASRGSFITEEGEIVNRWETRRRMGAHYADKAKAMGRWLLEHGLPKGKASSRLWADKTLSEWVEWGLNMVKYRAYREARMLHEQLLEQWVWEKGEPKEHAKPPKLVPMRYWGQDKAGTLMKGEARNW